MPEYKFKNKNTGKEWLEWLTISQRTEFLEANPHIEQKVHGFPGFVDTVRLERTTPDESFKDLLGQIKKNNIGSNFNTFK